MIPARVNVTINLRLINNAYISTKKAQKEIGDSTRDANVACDGQTPSFSSWRRDPLRQLTANFTSQLTSICLQRRGRNQSQLKIFYSQLLFSII
jgi:hypothetical protein